MKHILHRTDQEQIEICRTWFNSYFECLRFYNSLPQILTTYEQRYTSIKQIFRTRLQQTPNAVNEEHNRLHQQWIEMDNYFESTLNVLDVFFDRFNEFEKKVEPEVMKLTTPKKVILSKVSALIQKSHVDWNEILSEAGKLKQMLTTLNEIMMPIEKTVKKFVN